MSHRNELPSTGAEKRLHPRFELMEYAMVRSDPDEESIRAVVVDVSLGGLQVRCRESFDIGLTVTLEIGYAGQEDLILRGEARYCEPIEGTDLIATGFRIAANDRHTLQRWVDYVRVIFRDQGEALVD